MKNAWKKSEKELLYSAKLWICNNYANDRRTLERIFNREVEELDTGASKVRTSRGLEYVSQKSQILRLENAIFSILFEVRRRKLISVKRKMTGTFTRSA